MEVQSTMGALFFPFCGTKRNALLCVRRRRQHARGRGRRVETGDGARRLCQRHGGSGAWLSRATLAASHAIPHGSRPERVDVARQVPPIATLSQGNHVKDVGHRGAFFGWGRQKSGGLGGGAPPSEDPSLRLWRKL